MKNIILTTALILVSLTASSQTKKDINDVAQTKKIVAIEYGVTCGKTGKSAVYVYSKNKYSKGFNVATDRELVYSDSLSILRQTAQYKKFIKSI